MRRRHLYVLLFALPALLVASISSAFAAGAVAGVLWIFVFGDNPWPSWVGGAVGVGVLAAGAGFYALLLWLAYQVGRREEQHIAINRTHVALAIGSAVALLAIVAPRLGGIRLTPQTDNEVCAELCRGQGFMASGMPARISGDRTCSCYDAAGREARRVPLQPRK